jgi:hypothetical protein
MAAPESPTLASMAFRAQSPWLHVQPDGHESLHIFPV